MQRDACSVAANGMSFQRHEALVLHMRGQLEARAVAPLPAAVDAFQERKSEVDRMEESLMNSEAMFYVETGIYE